MSNQKDLPLTLTAIAGSIFYVSLFSGDHIARKLLLKAFTPFGANAFLFLFSGLILCLIATHKKIALLPKKHQSFLLIIANGLHFSAMVIFLQISLINSTAGMANAIFCSYPVITYLTSVLFVKEDKFSVVRISGFGVVFIGFYMLISNNSSNQFSPYIFVATILIGSQICLVRKLVKEFGVVYTLVWQHRDRKSVV